MIGIAIIGGGLSGLSLAQRLQADQHDVAVFESRGRFGGRIATQPAEGEFRHDLGPSWMWPEFQPFLAHFIDQYGLEAYPQWNSGKSLYQHSKGQPPEAYTDYDTYAPARRITGGMCRLIEVLLPHLPPQSLKTNCTLRRVIDHSAYVELCFDGESSAFNVKAQQVIVTIPPRLLAATVDFEPALDSSLCELMSSMATWMAGQAKAVVRYRRAFWRDAGFSGNAMAVYPGAALGQIYDASSADGTQAALSGFFALPAAVRDQRRGELKTLVVEQLVHLLGKDAAQPEEIILMDWSQEPSTATAEDQIPAPGHPQYGHAYLRQAYWDDKLYFGGTETAAGFGGYLEGALEATERVVQSLSTLPRTPR